LALASDKNSIVAGHRVTIVDKRRSIVWDHSDFVKTRALPDMFRDCFYHYSFFVARIRFAARHETGLASHDRLDEDPTLDQKCFHFVGQSCPSRC